MVGKTISHYKILEKLGEGGMGVVYKAEDTKLKRIVALKLITQERARNVEAKQRFLHEAEAASALDHINICTVHEIDETDDGRIFLCMAYYEGETLKERIKRAPLSLNEVLDIAIQIAQGLMKAHEHDIVHRDIKPGNIMLTHDSLVKIVDFGLAKLASATHITKTGSTIGTIAYVSPEQARGDLVDHRSDIWSLGIVIYEMLTGQLPFKGDYDQVIIYSILNEQHKPASSLRTGIPSELETIISQALSKNRDERIQTMQEFLEYLLDIQSEYKPEEFSHVLRKYSRRILSHTTLVYTGLLSAILTGVLYFALQMIAAKTSLNMLFINIGFVFLIVLLVCFMFFFVYKRKEQRLLQSLSIVTVLVLCITVASLFLAMSVFPPVTKQQGNFAEQADRRMSVAVMYFDYPMGDSALVWLGKGIPDMLINNLSQSKYLQIISLDKLSGIMKSMGKSASVADQSITFEIARRAKADYLLTGTIIKSDEGLRILSQTSDVQSERLIKAEGVECKGVNRLIETVDQLSNKMRIALEIEATGESRIAEEVANVKTTSLEAYKYYILGTENLAKLYHREAIPSLRKAIQIDSTFSHAYAALANAYDVLGENSLAEEVVQKALRFSSKLSEVEQLRILLRSAQIKSDWDAELNYLKKLIMLQPNESLWHFYLGWHYDIHKRDYGQGISEFRKAIEIDSVSETKYYYYLGYAYIDAMQYDDALKMFNKLVSMRENDASSHDALGTVYLMKWDFENALTEFRYALKIRSDFVQSTSHLGDLSFAKGNVGDALAYYDSCLTRALAKNQEKEARFSLAKTYFEIKKYEDALREAKTILATDPFMLRALWITGLVFLETSRLDSAELVLKNMHNSIQQSHTRFENEYYYHLLGKIDEKKKNFRSATESLQAAIKLGPWDRAYFLKSLAEIYFAAGHFDSTKITVNKIFEFNPHYAYGHYLMGRVYEQNGELRKAQEEYKVVLTVWSEGDGEIPVVKDVKKRLLELQNNL